MITVRNLSKSFGRLKALDSINVVLEAGRSVMLIGPNGSGKTTLIKCLLGLVIPDEGWVTLDGEDLLADPALRARIGYMPQIGRFPDHLKVGQIIEMMKGVRRATTTRYDEDLIHSFEIGKIADKPAHTLSGGMRQKLGACLAFLFKPDVLILDEPTAGLDPLSAEIFKEKVRVATNEGKLVLITSHILSDLEDITSEVLYLMDGRVQFHQSLAELAEEYGERRLGPLIAHIMKSGKHG